MRALELVRSAWLRVKALLRRTQLERDLDDELMASGGPYAELYRIQAAAYR